MLGNGEKQSGVLVKRMDILWNRRRFLSTTIFFSFLWSLPSKLWAYFVERLGVRTVEKENFYFDAGTHSIVWKETSKREPYALEIRGLIGNQLRISYQELLDLPQTEQASDFHCVEGWSVKDIQWSGVRFGEIVVLAKPLPQAKYVLFHALGETGSEPQGQRHYVECLPLAHLLDSRKECLLALGMNRDPLPHDHGAPLRVVAPYDLGYKSIKFVYRIDFVDKEYPGWWTLANPVYPVDAPVPSSRLRKKS
ncbi:MAG: molybdopterin-dependent oxidoreductase [Acidobacteriota bacterium]